MFFTSCILNLDFLLKLLPAKHSDVSICPPHFQFAFKFSALTFPSSGWCIQLPTIRSPIFDNH